MGAQSVVKGVRSLAMPQMRSEGAAKGTDLLGIGIVPIDPTFYLVGLTQGSDNLNQNYKLLQDHDWFDVPFTLVDGKPAKITFEKGAQGSTIVAAALDSWK